MANDEIPEERFQKLAVLMETSIKQEQSGVSGMEAFEEALMSDDDIEVYTSFVILALLYNGFVI